MAEQQGEDSKMQFSDKYSPEYALRYHEKHRESWGRRISNRREQAMARKALAMAGQPGDILDLPCGAGRFLPMLAEQTRGEIWAADNSAGMLEAVRSVLPATLLSRIRLLQTSAYAIDLPDQSVDTLVSMRLLHHIRSPEDRLRIYREFHRVTRRSVVLSLWVDGNYGAWRRRRLEAKRPPRLYENRFVLPVAQAESELLEAGFRIIGHVDFLPRYSMWRCYVLGRD